PLCADLRLVPKSSPWSGAPLGPYSVRRMERTEAEHLLARLQHGRSRYVVRCPDALEDLEARVHETASWCATFLEPEAIVTSLRPPRLTPRLLARNRWE